MYKWSYTFSVIFFSKAANTTDYVDEFMRVRSTASNVLAHAISIIFVCIAIDLEIIDIKMSN